MSSLKGLKKMDMWIDRSNQSQIAQKLRELTGEDIEPETLHEKLEQAETAGLIERKITNIYDEPYIHWKPRF